MIFSFTYEALPVSRPALASNVVPILAFFDTGVQPNALTERRRTDHGSTQLDGRRASRQIAPSPLAVYGES